VTSFRKYFCVMRIALAERLVYRTDFFLGTLMRFAPMVTTILLWRAIYQGSTTQEYDGLTYQNVVAYYLLTMVSRAFSSMPGLSGGIARDVREGTIQKYLIQPIDQVAYLLMTRLAHKLVYYAVAAAPYAIVFYLCRGFFAGWPGTVEFAAGLASLVMAFFLGFFFEVSVGLLAFWFLEISSLLFVVMSLNYFLSGHMVPLELMPDGIEQVMRLLPFQYLAYFPAMALLGQIERPDLAAGLAAQLGWTIGFAVLCRVLYRRGLRRYSAFGG